jgi:hypothetical protein
MQPAKSLVASTAVLALLARPISLALSAARGQFEEKD